LLRSFRFRTPSARPPNGSGWPANFQTLLSDENYAASFTTALFSALVAVLGIALSLVLAVFADRIKRPRKTLLVVPYAVAPAVAGVLGLHVFTLMGVVAYALGQMGISWNHLLDGEAPC
jgi:sn-glycerol 3-phosphate transport system permease protein